MQDKKIKSVVAVKRCNSYKKDNLLKKIKEALIPIGGLEPYIRPAKTILLKPNLLSATGPENGITTHPIFIECVIELIKKIKKDSFSIIIADSPGISTPHTLSGLKNLYKKCGLDYLNKIDKVTLSYDENSTAISFKEGKVLKHLDVIRPVIDSDIIINLPKFKTHSLTRISGAVKNMFGIIHGRNKTLLHTKFIDLYKFNEMLLDIYLYARPVLNIMDGITGIEGEGPGASGTKRGTGLILASTDGIAMDNVVGNIMGLKSDNIPIIKCAKNRKFYSADLKNIEIPGENLENLLITGYRLPKNTPISFIFKNKFLNRYILPFIRNNLHPSPYQDLDNCNLCGTCINICPEKAISQKGNSLIFDYKKCIRCYCCSEMCQYDGIDLIYSWLGNLIFNTFK